MRNPGKTLLANLRSSAASYGKLRGCRDYIRYLIGLCVSRFGDGIDTIAFSMLIYRVTGSTLMVATLFAVNGLPNLIFGLLSGVVTSRRQEKYIMAFCDVGRGLLAFLTAALCMTGLIRPWHFYVITFLNSSFESFRSPAGTSIMPQLLPEESMGEGIALQTTMSRLFDMLGLTAVPVLLLFVSLEGTLFINGLTFLFCAFMTVSIRTFKKVQVKEEKAGYFQDMADGIRYMKGKSAILQILFFASFANVLFLPINVFQAPFVDVYLGGEAVVLSVMNIMITAGMMISTAAAPETAKKIPESKVFLTGGTGVCLCYFCLAAASCLGSILPAAIVLAAAGSFILGSSIAVVNFVIMMKFYRDVSQEYMSRVISIMNMFAMCILPLGSSLMGVALEWVTIRQLYVAAAVCSQIVFTLYYSRARGMEDRCAGDSGQEPA